MILETFAHGGCRSYLVGCEQTGAAVLIDPVLALVDCYRGLVATRGLGIRYVVESHTHADHFSGRRILREALGAPIVMHRSSPAPDVDLRLEHGEHLTAGRLQFTALHTPGHTADSMCLRLGDTLFTGDTLLIGGVGRTDLPTGDPSALHRSLFDVVFKLPPETRILPAHDYRGLGSSTLAAELAENPRLKARGRAAFVRQMQQLTLEPPRHLTEALRTNIGGGRTVGELLAEAAMRSPRLSPAALRELLSTPPSDLVLLDLREEGPFRAGHIPGACRLGRGDLELRVDAVLTDPTARVVACCETGAAAALGAATLRDLGFSRVSVLDGGLAAWRVAGGAWAANTSGTPARP